MRPTSRFSLLVMAAAVTCSAGCTQSITFTTGTQMGIELNAVEGGRQTARVGYQRFEGVVMPVRDYGGEEKLLKEAYPVLAVIQLDTGSLLLSALTTTKIRQVFATGDAATTTSAVTAVAKVASYVSLVKLPDVPGVEAGDRSDPEKAFEETLDSIADKWDEIVAAKRNEALQILRDLTQLPGLKAEDASRTVRDLKYSSEAAARAKAAEEKLKALINR